MIDFFGNLIQVVRRKSLWILIAAIFLSVSGHLILFFGLPFISFGSPPPIAEDLIIKTELRVEPPKKIQLTSAPKKKSAPKKSNAVSSDPLLAQGQGEQGAVGNQSGQAFRLPESGTYYFDAYVDGQLYQTAQLDWITEGNNYRLYINIPYAVVGPFVFESRGSVDAYGIAPSIYWTQRGTKHLVIPDLIEIRMGRARCTSLKNPITRQIYYRELRIVLASCFNLPPF